VATIEREFLEFMHQTIQIEPMIDREPDGGDPIFGDPKLYRARIVAQQRLVVDSNGQERMSRSVGWIHGVPEDLTTDARITLPNGEQPFVINIHHYPDETGMHHVKIDFA